MFCDRHAVLKMGGTLPVLGNHRPAVLQHHNLVCTLIYHWLDGQYQTGFQEDAAPVGDVVENRRLFMKTLTNAVTGELFH